MYYKLGKSGGIEAGIITANRPLLPHELANNARVESLNMEPTVRTLNVEPGMALRLPKSSIENLVPIESDLGKTIVLSPMTAFQRTEEGKLRLLIGEDSFGEEFEADEATSLVVVESRIDTDGNERLSYSPLSKESNPYTATREVKYPTGDVSVPAFAVSIDEEGAVVLANSYTNSSAVKMEIDESKAEREAQANQAAINVGRVAVNSVLERAAKTSSAKAMLERVDAKKLQAARRAEIKAERPTLKAQLKEQKVSARNAKRELRSTMRANSGSSLRKERRQFLRDAMKEYKATNSNAKFLERRAMKKGIREIARKDVANAAQERINTKLTEYNAAYKAADSTRRNLHEGSRRYAVGGRNTIAENLRILGATPSAVRGEAGSLRNIEDDRRKRLMDEVEKRRKRIDSEKYKKLRESQAAAQAKKRADALKAQAQAKKTT